jgi:hypothetical protein
MNVVIAIGSAVTMFMGVTGLYSLQAWLERTDYQRHFED